MPPLSSLCVSWQCQSIISGWFILLSLSIFSLLQRTLSLSLQCIWTEWTLRHLIILHMGYVFLSQATVPNRSLPSSLLSCEDLHLVSMAFPKCDHRWFSIYFQITSDVQWYSNRHEHGFPLTFHSLRLYIECLLAAMRSWQVILSHHTITCFT